MKYKDNQIVYEVGDFVVLSQYNYGYEKGDIAKVVGLECGSIVVYVPDRISDSQLHPNVAYPTSWVRPATESEMESFKEEKYYYLNKELPFTPVGSKIYNHRGTYFKINSDNIDAFVDLSGQYGSGYGFKPGDWTGIDYDRSRKLIFIGRIKDLLAQGWVRKGE